MPKNGFNVHEITGFLGCVENYKIFVNFGETNVYWPPRGIFEHSGQEDRIVSFARN